MHKANILKQEYFNKNAEQLAQDLLGCILVHESAEGITSGIIVETEAYSQEDAASHTFKGETPRTKAMFGPGGRAYIYFTYGMHYCFNVVSGQAGHGQGVLIRALQPKEGIDLMKERRQKNAEKELCNGPAKLVQAMGISMTDYGKPLFEGSLYIVGRESGVVPQIVNGPRVGISRAKDVPWRFWIKDNTYISK